MKRRGFLKAAAVLVGGAACKKQQPTVVNPKELALSKPEAPAEVSAGGYMQYSASHADSWRMSTCDWVVTLEGDTVASGPVRLTHELELENPGWAWPDFIPPSKADERKRKLYEARHAHKKK